MNRLSITISNEYDEEGELYRGVELSIDDIDLRSRVKDFETPFAEREGAPDLAGDYHWLDLASTTPEVLLGEVDREYGIREVRVALMGCSCGVVSCWPLECKIEITDDTVTWSEFEQPHRSVRSAASHWDYSSFGPFIFRREEYSAELSVLLSKG